MSDLTALQVERSYRASAQSVFDAWTNPEVMRRSWQVLAVGARTEGDGEIVPGWGSD
ncbi:MAG: hypothetical protein QOK21_943 [Solirubrobacteraceae bacterium]|jgi:uncharacterized protein YndB with AHSA1/START domain|nr:hypothetical protein [Solirubrobacteraceae bacterium]